jgi:hypothetical protein
VDPTASRAEHDAVLGPNNASTPRALDNLGIEELREWHPARCGPRTFSLAALELHPLAVMRDKRGEGVSKAVGQEQWGAIRHQYCGHLMDKAWSHGQSALTRVNCQDELGADVHLIA